MVKSTKGTKNGPTTKKLLQSNKGTKINKVPAKKLVQPKKELTETETLLNSLGLLPDRISKKIAQSDKQRAANIKKDFTAHIQSLALEREYCSNNKIRAHVSYKYLKTWESRK